MHLFIVILERKVIGRAIDAEIRLLWCLLSLRSDLMLVWQLFSQPVFDMSVTFVWAVRSVSH